MDLFVLLSSPVGLALASIVAFVGVIAAVRALNYTRKQTELAMQASALQISEQLDFPFYCLSVEQLKSPEYLPLLHITNVSIRYVPRLPADQFELMLKEWIDVLERNENPYLLIKGIGGLGKTREVIELLSHLEQQLPYGNHLTIIIPKSNITTLDFPADLSPENLVLLVNDIHLKDEYHTQLEKMLEFFAEKTKGYKPFRVIVTTRSEPELWQRIKPKSALWNRFTHCELPKLHPSQVDKLIDAVIETLGGLSLDYNARKILADKNDGTIGNLILFLGTEYKRGNLFVNGQVASERFIGQYAQQWQTNIYTPFIKNYPLRVSVFAALRLLNEFEINFSYALIVEISSRIWKARYPIWLKKILIRNSIKTLNIWLEIREHDDLVACPDLYLDNITLQDSGIFVILNSAIAALNNRHVSKGLVSTTFTLATTGLRLGHFTSAARILKQLISHDPLNAQFRDEYAGTLFQKGFLKQAQKEHTLAMILDPAETSNFVGLAVTLGEQGYFESASRYFKTGFLNTISFKYWMLSEYAGYFLTPLGEYDAAISYLDYSTQHNPAYPHPYYLLIQLFVQQGKNKEAEKYIQEVRNIQLTALAFGELWDRGHLYLSMQEFEKALDFYSKAIQVRGERLIESYEPYLGRARCYLELKQIQNYKRDLKAAEEIVKILIYRCSRNYTARYALALIYLLLGKSKQALQQLHSAKRLCDFPGITDKWTYWLNQFGKVQPEDMAFSEFHKILTSSRNQKKIVSSFTVSLDQFKETKATTRVGNALNPLIRIEGNRKDLEDHAYQIKDLLDEQEIDIVESNVRVKMTAAQTIKSVEIAGVEYPALVTALTSALKASSQLAAKFIIEARFKD